MLAFGLLGALAANGAELDRTTVFKAGQGEYKVYRIPAAIMTPKGTLLAFCEGRASASDTGDIKLIVKRSSDNGKTFGKASVVWSEDGNTCGNPCPVIDESTGTIWLLMTHNPGKENEARITDGTSKGGRTVWVTSSTDDGLTWATPREITSDVKKPQWGWYATGPGVGIQLKHGPHAGRMIIPCDYGMKHAGNSHVIYSDDHGATWKIGGEAPKQEFNESQCVELTGGRVMLNMRNWRDAIAKGAPKQRGVCVSDDGGITFKDLRRDPTLIEPVCQASIIRASWEPNRILFSNPASSDKREKLTVRVSEDEGATWPVERVIHEGPAAYSSLVALPDGMIGILFECGEKKAIERIDFVRFKFQ